MRCNADVEALYCTHRHHSEGCVDDADSYGGVDGLGNSCFLKDPRGVVENLRHATITSNKQEILVSLFYFIIKC